MRIYRLWVGAIVAVGILTGAAAFAVPCGNQDYDNRPNKCDVDGREQVSSCRVIAPGRCEYTHCDGVTTRVIEDPRCCCRTYDKCTPNPSYVVLCLGGSAAAGWVDPNPEDPGGLPPPSLVAGERLRDEARLDVVVIIFGAVAVLTVLALIMRRRPEDGESGL